ncbi:MAG: DUF433 domain-containing protein [Chthoniobacteraceae bacterium]
MAEFFRVTKDPTIMGGKACIRDTHITVSAVIALLSSGHQRDEVIRMLPVLTMEDLTEAVAYASRLIDDPESALREIEMAEGTAPSALPKTGPAPLNTPVSHAPSRKITPLGSPIEAPSATTAVAEAPEAQAGISEAPSLEQDELLPHPYVPEAEDDFNPELDESIELYHPRFPDLPTVTVSPEGICDRRWCTHVIAWPDIAAVERLAGHKYIKITLRNPALYVAAMPLLKRVAAQLKMALGIAPFYMDTTSLGVRTKDIYYMATRLWHIHRGSIKFRKKRRVRIGKSSRDTAWEKCLPR